MIHLTDIRTLSSVSSAISLTLCVCMLYVFQTRKTYRGFGHWTIATILYSVALSLIGFRNFLPDFVSIVVGNTLIVAGNGFLVRGVEGFAGRPERTWFYGSLVLLTAVLFAIFTYRYPGVNIRIVVISIVLAMLYGYIGYIVHRYVPSLIGGPNRFLLFVFGAQAAWNVLRLFQALFIETPIADFMTASAFHAVTIVIFFCGNIFVVIGLLVLNFQRVEFDLYAAMEEIKTLRGIIPICSCCKKIKNEQGMWRQIEAYVRDHSEAEFSHGICPECREKLYSEFPIRPVKKSGPADRPLPSKPE